MSAASRSGVRMWRIGVAVVATLAFAAVVADSGPHAGAASSRIMAEKLPPGFSDALVATVNEPVALAATPDGRILVADKSGVVRVVRNGSLLPTPALDISATVCAKARERGMLGIAVDPKFASNGFVYLYYTFDRFNSCKRFTKAPVNRVARFSMTGDTIAKSSEKVLVDNMISYFGNHNAGDLGFGKDGKLYVSVGDGGCDYTIGQKACDVPNNTNAISQKLNTLQGKVLRITPSGGIPSDNPFTGPGTTRCNKGYDPAGRTCQEIYLFGLRNPFRFAFDPNSASTRLFVNDTGEFTWEEIDRAVAGANYGWNVREGPCPVGETTGCGSPPPGMTNPTFWYPHEPGNCDAITGGAFVPNGLWGSADNGGYLYSDYVCNTIFLIVPKAGGGWKESSFASGLAPGGPITMTFAPHAGHTALYYTTYTADMSKGEVHAIEHN